jgi:hypothetical protein
MRPKVDTPPGLDAKPYYAAAFGIGIIAAGVMTVLMWMARRSGFSDLDLAMTLGTASVFTDDPNAGAWTQGLIVMLIAGGVFALGYAWVFEFWPHHRARAWIGALVGMVHAVIGGAMMWMLMPVLHSGTGADPRLADPGFMGASYGSGAVAVFVGLHVVYGTIIGGWMHFAPVATRYLGELAAKDVAREGTGQLRTT